MNILRYHISIRISLSIDRIVYINITTNRWTTVQISDWIFVHAYGVQLKFKPMGKFESLMSAMYLYSYNCTYAYIHIIGTS